MRFYMNVDVRSSAGADGVAAPQPLNNNILQNQTALKRMNKYRKEVCEGVTPTQMVKYIAGGQEIAKKLSQINLNGFDQNFIGRGRESGLKFTKEEANHLMWYMMAMAASKGEEYVSGSMVIDDPKQAIYYFLKKCGDSYPRASTHFASNPDIPKMGLDLGDRHVLPAGKRTIHFGVTEKATFIKMEYHGLPGLSNVWESLGHAWDFMISMIYTRNRGYEARNEKIKKLEVGDIDKKPFLEVFSSAIKNLEEAKELLVKAKITLPSLDKGDREVEKELEKGKGRLSAYQDYIKLLKDKREALSKALGNAFVKDSKIAGSDYNKIRKQLNQINSQLEQLDQDRKIQAAKNFGFEGKRHGNEVNLPAFSVYQAKTQM